MLADLLATGPYAPNEPTPPPGADGSKRSADRFDRAAALVADVADALHHAHQAGVTHRDIKPANLLRLLLGACGERPDWVAPRAFLALACNYAGDLAGETEHGNRALHTPPVTAEDFLFRGCMIGTQNPRRGLADVDEAAKRSRSVVAQIVRAEVLTVLADDGGRVEDAAAARDALRAARAVMGDSPLLALAALNSAVVGCNNCRLHGREAEARAWLAEAADDFRAVADRGRPDSHQHRTLYVLFRDGSADGLDAENRDAGLVPGRLFARAAHFASLLRQGRAADTLVYLDRAVPGPAARWTRVTVLAGGDPAATRAECRRAVAEADGRGGLTGAYVASLAGLPDEARRAAQAFVDRPDPAPEYIDFGPFVRRVAAHAFAGVPMDVEAEIGPSRNRRFMAYDTLGYAALGRGDRAAAVAWFRRADDHPPLFWFNYLSMRELRRRVIEDPTWPAWLAAGE